MPRTFHRHNRAHYGSDIFCRLHRLFCHGLKTQASKKQQLEKTSCEKTEGVTGCKKDRRVAETGPEEKNVRIDEIIARPH